MTTFPSLGAVSIVWRMQKTPVCLVRLSFLHFAHARTVSPRCQALLLGTPFGEAALAVIQLGHSAAAEQRFICEVGDHSPGGLSIGECRNRARSAAYTNG